MIEIFLFVYAVSVGVLFHGVYKDEGGCRLELLLIVALMITPVLNTIIAIGYLKELYNEQRVDHKPEKRGEEGGKRF